MDLLTGRDNDISGPFASPVIIHYNVIAAQSASHLFLAPLEHRF